MFLVLVIALESRCSKEENGCKRNSATAHRYRNILTLSMFELLNILRIYVPWNATTSLHIYLCQSRIFLTHSFFLFLHPPQSQRPGLRLSPLQTKSSLGPLPRIQPGFSGSSLRTSLQNVVDYCMRAYDWIILTERH